MGSIDRVARLTGVLILIIALLAPFSMLVIPETLVVPGDATATARNILASEGLFRLAMVSDAIIFLLEIAVVVLLYVLIKPVSEPLAQVATFARLAMTVVQGINLLTYFVVLLLLNGAGYLSGFAPEQVYGLVMLFVQAHAGVALIWGLFFALHLAVFGYLVYKSGYMPSVLGILLLIVALCYFTQSLGTVLLPQYGEAFTVIGYLAILEIAFPVWLLLRGVNVAGWRKRALAAA